MSQTDEILNEIRVYLRIAAAAVSRAKAIAMLDSQEKAVVYEKLDGVATQQSVSDVTKVPRQTVTRWAEEFVRAGLASAPDKFHPAHKALFSLAELGIDMNVLKKRAKSAANQPGAPPSQTLDANPSGGEGKSTSQ